MKCRDCGTENDMDAKYCRVCGKSLDYDLSRFLPTSLRKLRGNKILLFPFSFCIILMGVGIFTLIFQTLAEPFWERASSDMMYFDLSLLLAFGIVLPIFAFLTAKRCLQKIRNYSISTLADYIEAFPECPKYPLIMKNGKVGVFNRDQRKIQIPCKYRSITWKAKIGILSVIDDTNEEFTIDIYDNKLSI